MLHLQGWFYKVKGDKGADLVVHSPIQPLLFFSESGRPSVNLTWREAMIFSRLSEHSAKQYFTLAPKKKKKKKDPSLGDFAYRSDMEVEYIKNDRTA